jgi:ABC-type phosphate transport system substrate-binding protein
MNTKGGLMLENKFKKPYLIRQFVFFMVFFLLTCTRVHAVHDSHDNFRGSAFSDPTQVYEMSDEWKKQPINYDPSLEKVDLVVTLGQHLYPYVVQIIKQFATKHDLKIAVNEGTCGISAGMLSRKAVDIGGFCCAPGATDRLPGLKYHTVGIAALALIVNPNNPVDNVTIEQARHIYSGDIYRWSELKTPSGKRGAEMDIQAVARLHCKLRPGSWRLLLANEDLFSPAIQEVGAIPDMIYQVSINPRAIGYETMTAIYRYQSYKKAGKVKTLKINGYAHDDTPDLLNGNYPLYRVMSLTTWEGEGVENPHAQKLVDYIIREVEHLDSKFGIIPASRLKTAGWKFHGNELSGEPN